MCRRVGDLRMAEFEQGEPPKWRWVILGASFMSVTLAGCGAFHAGVMQVALLHHFHTDVFTTTWLMSYYTGVFALAGPVSSAVINLVNCRACVVLSGLFCLAGFVISSLMTRISHLYFTMSLVGTGQSMSIMGSVIILAYYFPDKASLVTGVCMTGGALGLFLHPALFQFLVDNFGVRGAFLLSGAVAFHSTLSGFLMRPSKFERSRAKTASRGSPLKTFLHSLVDNCLSNTSLLSSPALLIFLVSILTLSIAFNALIVILPNYLVTHSGLTPQEASMAVSFCGIGSLVSRLAAGFLAHDPRVGRLLVFSGLLGVEMLVSLAAPSLLTLGTPGAYLYCGMVGLYTGGSMILINPVVMDIVGLKAAATGFGLAMLMMGVGGFIGPPIAELLNEYGSTSYMLFGFISALFGVSALCCSLVCLFIAIPVQSVLPGDVQGKLENSLDAGTKSGNNFPEHEQLLLKTYLISSDESQDRLKCDSSREPFICNEVLKNNNLLCETVDKSGLAEGICKDKTICAKGFCRDESLHADGICRNKFADV